jgi:methyltransferase family protein
MSLLLSTDIDNQVKRYIRGFVARAGGSVDQLVDYRQCVVEDINIPDGGFGKVCKPVVGAVIRDCVPFIKRFLRQEILFFFQGHRVSRDRKTIVLDMHHSQERQELRNKYDCAVSSNLLEHSPNPIWLLLNFYFITKKNGYQFHAIPHYKYTYDRFRKPTPLDHFIEDFESRVDATDMSHVEDYRQSAVEKDGWQRRFHDKYPLEYPFIHFHVFDESSTKALMEFMFEDVVNDVYKTDKFSDNVVIFKNTLNKEFVERYKSMINGYSYGLFV